MKTELISRALMMLCLICAAGVARGQITNLPSSQEADPAAQPNLTFREIKYSAVVSDEEARFTAEVSAEALSAAETSQVLLCGEVGMLPPKLPPGLRIERTGNEYRLFSSRKGRHAFSVQFVARITKAEPWNQVSFLGPVAAIGSVTAQAGGADAELRLLQGTTVESVRSNGVARLKGYLGASPEVSLRWSRGTGETARKAVVTVDTAAQMQVTPTVIKHVTELHYEILQGKIPRVSVRLPSRQTVTRVVGDQVRDWELKNTESGGSNETQILTVEFIKPMEKNYLLTLHSEETVESMPANREVTCPEPLEVERESGLITITTEDVLAEIDRALNLRQVNAAAGALAGYRFSGRPFTLALNLNRIQPVIQVSERVATRLEETRLVAMHKLSVTVEKAGVYALDLRLNEPWAVAEVQGSGVEDWKLVGGEGSNRVLRVNFSSRVLGTRALDVQLEQALKTFPEQVLLASLRVVGATRETSQIGAGSARGIRLKTSELLGVREIPLNRLSALADELLAYASDQPDWKIVLGTERQSARVVADIFNLVTVGDGIVGGSATIRFGLLNQGVQEFELAVPAAWKNVEFTGPDIRRKEQRPDGIWVIGLQEKAWGGYTLVVTYDFQFDPRGATLSLGGIHAPGAERETGWVALTTAASLKLNAAKVSEGFRAVDEAELTGPDRALISRAVLLAYQYSEPRYALDVEVKRFDELPVLSAVADRTELTTVLTESGELLSQASFMVKNNDKQFQRFKLPAKAKFWGCYVNGAAVKADRDGDWLLTPLPRGANRDQAFAVDIVYAEKKPLNASLFSGAFQLEAPQTDVPNTYAEWQLFAPATLRLSAFGGNMTPARGTTYDFRDAWQKFVDIYRDLLTQRGLPLLLLTVVVGLIVALVGSAVRRGWSGVLSVIAVFCIVALLAAMMLPALSRAKARAQRINATNNLKQIGLAAKVYSMDNGNRLPGSFQDMMAELGTEKILTDPESGQQFVYMGGGLDADSIQPQSVIAFSPTDTGGHRAVLLADGSVQQLTSAKFAELSQRGFIVRANPQQAAQNRQATAVTGQQFLNAPLAQQQANPQADIQSGTAAAPARAMRIEIPRSGQAFMFTKVLNAGREPLSIRARLMKLQTFQTARMVLQLAAFLAGLGLWIWQWRRGRNSFLLTLALSLALGAVLDLLISWRILHMGLIFGTPLLVLLVIGWATWKFWPRGIRQPAVSGIQPEAPPAIVSILPFLLCFLALNGLAAQSDLATASLRSATFTGSVNDKVAMFDATLVVSATGPNVTLPLFGDDVAVVEFTTKPAEAKLVRQGLGVAAALARKGETTLQLKLLVALTGDITRRELAFGIPPALTTRVAVDIDQPDADVEFPTAVSHKRTTARERTHVDALIGSGDRVELRWTPRVKRAAEITANIICQNLTVARLGNGVLNARSTLDFQATQGEMRQLRVRLPVGHRLLRVEGESIRTWDVKGAGAEQVLTVELLKAVAPAYPLIVETERVLDALPAVVKVEIPHAVEVKRETGLIALQSDEELDVTVQRSDELLRVDSEEFGRLAGAKLAGQPNVFRFLKPEFGLEAKAGMAQPQVEATVRNGLRISPEQVALTATIDYTIKRAGVFKMRVVIPAQYRVESVTGTNLLQWAERGEGPERQLEVTLKERTSGSYRLGLELQKNLKELPPTLELAGVHPVGAGKVTGFISVTAEPGVGLKPALFEGLTEIPAAAAGNDAAGTGSVLAYKYFGTEGAAPAWKLAVTAESMQSWVRADVVNTVTVTDTLLSGRALVRYEIQNAPIKELRLRIPAHFRNVEISGTGIRRRDQEGEVWSVEFQNKLKGYQTLSVTWDQTREAGTNVVNLQGIGADTVERETGIIAIVARPPLQVSGREVGDLKSIDTRELPEWAGRPDEATVLAYRYVRPGYTLALEARRFQQAEMLQTLAENVSLTTVVADDGQAMTEMTMAVRNHGRQHLEVTLPPGATVWSAFVAGQPVRPSLREGRLLLPLEQSGPDDAPVAITLTYIGTNFFPATRGTVELASPQLDVPLKAARWDLFLPPDYAYSDFAGTMSRELGGSGGTGLVSSFSQLDYRHIEVRNKAEQANEVKSELSSAQRKLSAGNVKDALADFNRAKSRANYNNDRDAGTRKLEEDLKRAQGSNLILAQNAFSLNNAGKLDTQQSQGQALRYDNASAEQQWLKLQQAQELGAGRVQPIHVNLPTRGLRYGFAQVLQTEPGRPMTIRLQAFNEKIVNWPARGLGLAAAFLALWAAVFVVSRPRTISA